MKVINGTVVEGKIIIEGEPLADGSKVTVIAREDESTFELSPTQEAEILEAISENERGNGIDAGSSRTSKQNAVRQYQGRWRPLDEPLGGGVKCCAGPQVLRA